MGVWRVVVLALIGLSVAGCTRTLEVDIVRYEMCRGIHATTLCPLGETGEGDILTFHGGIEGHAAAPCRAQRLRVEHVTHFVPVPDAPTSTTTLLDVLDDKPVLEGFTLLATPAELRGEGPTLWPFELSCATDVDCAALLDADPGIYAFHFQCVDDAPVLMGAVLDTTD